MAGMGSRRADARAELRPGSEAETAGGRERDHGRRVEDARLRVRVWGMRGAIRKAGFAGRGPPRYEVPDVQLEVGSQADVGLRPRGGPIRRERMPDLPHRRLQPWRLTFVRGAEEAANTVGGGGLSSDQEMHEPS
jgi:hypothetical protein